MEESGRTTEPPGAATAGSGIALLPRRGEHPGFTLWRVSLALVAGMFGLAVAHVSGPVAWTVLTVLVCWCITWAHPLTALAAGVEAWALETGFGVHRQGELSFTRSDLLRLGALVAVTVLVAAVTRRASAGPSMTHERPRRKR